MKQIKPNHRGCDLVQQKVGIQRKESVMKIKVLLIMPYTAFDRHIERVV